MPDSTGADTGERRRVEDRSRTRRIVFSPTFQVGQVITLVTVILGGALWVNDGREANTTSISDLETKYTQQIEQVKSLAQLNRQAIAHEREQREIIGNQLTADVQEVREDIGRLGAELSSQIQANNVETNRKLDKLIEREIQRLENNSGAP